MNTEPLISIIIPVYNMEKYINICLDSLMSQTYTNLEIICVNDGSKDRTLELLETAREKDSRIQVINQENQGPLLARKNGISNMHGECFFFMDADDYLEKNAIQILYNMMANNNTDIAITNFQINGKNNFNFNKDTLSVDEVLADILNCKAKMFPCWGMLNRCRIDYEYKGYHLCEDELYALDLIVDTKTVSFSTKPLITYRGKERKAIVPKDGNFYYQGFLAARDFYDIICKDKPHLQNYAKCRLLMHTFFGYFNCRKDKSFSRDNLATMLSVIKTNRKAVLCNSDAAPYIRLMVFLSYFGMGFSAFMYNIYAKYKRV